MPTSGYTVAERCTGPWLFPKLWSGVVLMPLWETLLSRVARRISGTLGDDYRGFASSPNRQSHAKTRRGLCDPFVSSFVSKLGPRLVAGVIAGIATNSIPLRVKRELWV